MYDCVCRQWSLQQSIHNSSETLGKLLLNIIIFPRQLCAIDPDDPFTRWEGLAKNDNESNIPRAGTKGPCVLLVCTNNSNWIIQGDLLTLRNSLILNLLQSVMMTIEKKVRQKKNIVIPPCRHLPHQQ